MVSRLFVLVVAPLLFASASYADVTYLIGTAGDVLSHSTANSINSHSLTVGHCQISIDFFPCYWDLNEASTPLTDTVTGITAPVVNPHLVPPIGCAFASSEIVDITDTGQLLGRALSLEPGPCSAGSLFFTAQLPFSGWTQLASPASWTHTATLQNATWIVTNGSDPFGGSFLAEANPVPEPSSVVLLAVATAVLLVGKRRRSRRIEENAPAFRD